MLVAQGLGVDSGQGGPIVSFGLGLLGGLGLSLNELLCVVQDVQVLQWVQSIAVCERGMLTPA